MENEPKIENVHKDPLDFIGFEELRIKVINGNKVRNTSKEGLARKITSESIKDVMGKFRELSPEIQETIIKDLLRERLLSEITF